MNRIFAALLCLVLALVAPAAATAQSCPDGDGDGVCDSADNCTNVANPPPVSPPALLNLSGGQTDADMDGFGNQCDCDLDNDADCDISDFNAFLGDFTAGTDSGVGSDMTADGTVDIGDFSQFLPGFVLGSPGPRCDECPIVGQDVDFTPPPPPDPADLGFPETPHGTYLAYEIGGATLEVDPTLNDPITSMARCISWVTSCAAPGQRSLDDCARSAPQCQTAEPWNEAEACCPGACFSLFEIARTSGASTFGAYEQVYLGDASCFPGVQSMLEGN